MVSVAFRSFFVLCLERLNKTLHLHFIFFLLSDQEFRPVLEESSDSNEGDEGDSEASDDEAGVAGPPGQFTVIMHLCKINFVPCVHMLIMCTYVNQISNHNFCCFCSVQFPLLLQFLFLIPVKLFPLLLHISINLLFIFGEIILVVACLCSMTLCVI